MPSVAYLYYHDMQQDPMGNMHPILVERGYVRSPKGRQIS